MKSNIRNCQSPRVKLTNMTNKSIHFIDYIWYILQVVYELPTSTQWCFDVQWCPRNPAIISSSSFDGHVSLYSLMGGGHPIHMPDKVSLLFYKIMEKEIKNQRHLTYWTDPSSPSKFWDATPKPNE